MYDLTPLPFVDRTSGGRFIIMAETSIAAHFAALPDPRVDRMKLHSLHDILVIAICAILCGADDWASIELFGKAKESWFRKFLDLPHGIPSHDTFGRVFAALDAEAFSKCFVSWIQAIAELSCGEVVAIDGKTLRRTFDRAAEKAAVHMVSAWASANRMVLGQVKTADKSNEITAIPKLLDMLALKGCIVTIDAMGCQKEIVAKIVEKEADYVLGLKGNQGTLHALVEAYFREALKADFAGVEYSYHETAERAHGRQEVRRIWCTSDLDWFERIDDWAKLRSIAMVERERVVAGQKSIEKSYYISSLIGRSAKRFGKATRDHWGVESMHWTLDMAFREDESRMRMGNAAANLATMHHIALNLLKQEKTAKVGVKNKRLKAGWDESYLLKLLGI
jgi:predicted transposase YbfD/YdcC